MTDGNSEFPLGSDIPAPLHARREQMFPVLTDAEIARVRRFGTLQHYRRGERLFAAGKPGPGMFVVLTGTVAGSSSARLHNFPVAPRWLTPMRMTTSMRCWFHPTSCVR